MWQCRSKFSVGGKITPPTLPAGSGWATDAEIAGSHQRHRERMVALGHSAIRLGHGQDALFGAGCVCPQHAGRVGGTQHSHAASNLPWFFPAAANRAHKAQQSSVLSQLFQSTADSQID